MAGVAVTHARCRLRVQILEPTGVPRERWALWEVRAPRKQDRSPGAMKGPRAAQAGSPPPGVHTAGAFRGVEARRTRPPGSPDPSGLSNVYPRGWGLSEAGSSPVHPNLQGVACPWGRGGSHSPGAPPAHRHLSHGAALSHSGPHSHSLVHTGPRSLRRAHGASAHVRPHTLPVAHVLSLQHPLSSTPAARRFPRAPFAEGN